MKKRLLLLPLPLIALVLELLPWGAVLNFANPEGEPWRKTYSYFSLVPFGYANFGPLLTAVLTCVLLLLLVVYCFSAKGRLLGAGKVVLAVCLACSLSPLLFGIRSFSVVAALISAALAVEWLLLERYRKKL